MMPNAMCIRNLEPLHFAAGMCCEKPEDDDDDMMMMMNNNVNE